MKPAGQWTHVGGEGAVLDGVLEDSASSEPVVLYK